MQLLREIAITFRSKCAKCRLAVGLRRASPDLSAPPNLLAMVGEEVGVNNWRKMEREGEEEGYGEKRRGKLRTLDVKSRFLCL